MRRPLISLSLFALFCPVTATAVVLENVCLRLEISPQTGSIARILDKRTQRDYITEQTRTKLFRLLLPRPDYLSRRINSWDQKVSSIEAEGGNLKLKFRNLQVSQQKYVFQAGTLLTPEPQLPIDVTIEFRLESDHIVTRIEVENHSSEEITDVLFPWIDGLNQKSGESAAEVVLPALAQRVRSSTGGYFFGERAIPYPALLATSWMNYELGIQGIGIEVRSHAETQDALLSLSPNEIEPRSPSYYGPHDFPYIAWNFYPHIDGPGGWKSAEVVIHVHDSDWHTIAREHREWYRGLYRPKRVAAFDHEIGFATHRLKKDDNTVNWAYDDIEKLAQDANRAGIRTLVIDGWREREGPGNPDPFDEFADLRMKRGADLKSVIDRLGEQGIVLLFSFHPTLINTIAEQYKKDAHRWTVKTRRQANQFEAAGTFYTLDFPYQDHTVHYWATIDPASSATDYLLKEAERLKNEYGFRNLFLKGVGLQSFLSYNRETAVAPQTVYEVGYARFLGGLRKLFPDGLLMMEGFNDLVNPYSDAGYTWTQTDNAEILAYSLPWVPFSDDVEALDYDQANASFARKILINLIVDGGDGTVGRYPEFARHLKALQALKEATAQFYAEAEFRDQEGLRKLKADPDVMVKVFQNAMGGQTGVVLANLSDQRKHVSAELNIQSQSAKGHLWRLGGQQEDAILTPEFSIELGSYEVAVLGIVKKE